jgi:hypothetical protein
MACLFWINMRSTFFLCLVLLTLSRVDMLAQVAVTVDAMGERKKISPYIYGRNNSFSTDPNWTLPQKELVLLKDAGVTFFRENGGNNSTKYNWRRKLSSHPDWYNNVYTNDWDKVVGMLQSTFPTAQGMWAFQLIGKVAKTSAANFDDWGYNQSRWWEGVNQNLAGNGTVNPSGQKALVEGKPELYLENWNADSTTGILDHWFDPSGLAIKKEQVLYWNMDNEPEIWEGTHDDVIPVQPSAEDFMQRYFEVAKKARAIFPEIKLVGPVTANEWQWYNWGTNPVLSEGKYYPWLEFFIKRIAEEQRASGLRLLDVLDIHFYPSTRKTEEVVQLHRVFFDKTFDFSEANGVKNSSGSYDNSKTKEYIFARISDWLTAYLGPDHGVKLGMTEAGIDQSIVASVTSVWYASMLGEFMKNEVELFCPWYWKIGMWETLHLFTRYNRTEALTGVSSNELEVSAYPSVNTTGDSLAIVLVNRSPNETKQVKVRLDNFVVNGTSSIHTIAGLPATETFVSRTQNALKHSTIEFSLNEAPLTLAPMSVTSVEVRGTTEKNVILGPDDFGIHPNVKAYPNPLRDTLRVEWEHADFDKIEVVDGTGKLLLTRNLTKNQRTIQIDRQLAGGVYFVRLIGNHQTITKKIITK